MGMELITDNSSYYEMADGYASDSETQASLWIREALRSIAEGDETLYNQLIEVISIKPSDPDQEAMLVTSLRALSGAVSAIDDVHHDSLLSLIFRMSIWNDGHDVANALVELIIGLAVSSGKFVDACLDMLVRNFLPPTWVPSFDHLRGTKLPFLRKPGDLAGKGEVLDRVHAALQNITELVPLAPLRLLPIVLQRMPHIYDPTDWNLLYVENMLRLESGGLGDYVGSTMLMAVVDRLIDLDVDIRWEDIIPDDSSKGIFDMELEGLEENADDFRKENGIELPTLGRRSLGEVANKLDSLMDITFEYLKSCSDRGRLTQVFETLIQSFKVTVLNAYKSKFAQFVVFYACSLDPENCGVKFASLLADIFVCSTHPPFTRMSAVAYLASFLCRGRFLSASLVLSSLKRMVDWCFEYCQCRDGELNMINPEAHRVFYSGCQAIIYVLCYRMRSIMDVPHLEAQLYRLPLEPILHHRLDPLKVCFPDIVAVFLERAKAVNLFSMSETSQFQNLCDLDTSKLFGGIERLDMFFPFDPYLLKKSYRFIRPVYMTWTMALATYDDGYSDDESVEGDIVEGKSEISLENGDLPESLTEYEIAAFESSMNRMSITPKSSLRHKFPIRSQEKSPALTESRLLTKMPARIRPSTSPV